MIKLFSKIKSVIVRFNNEITRFIYKYPWTTFIIFILLISYSVYSLIRFNNKLDSIPEKTVVMEIYGFGNIDAKSSSATVRINMDYWGIDSVPYNSITIRNYPQLKFPTSVISSGIKNVLSSAGDNMDFWEKCNIDSIGAYYVIKYRMFSSEISNYKSKYNENSYAISIGNVNPPAFTINHIPYKDTIDNKECIAGDCTLAFGNSYGLGTIIFTTNVDNQFPKYNQLRKLSALRLKIDLLSKLKIDTLELNFYGGANYTDITPSPDFISNQFIRYTNVQKIHDIEQDGLDVVCSFDQPSGKQQARSSLIWIFISLLIGGIGVFYKLASQIHNEKKQSK